MKRKVLTITSHYEAFPTPFYTCQGCAFDGPMDCPEADCGGIIWKLKEETETLEEIEG